VTPLPRSLFQPVILELLRAHFSSFGAINQWVPLPGFARIIIVYEQEEHAEKAKLCSDSIILSANKERQVKFIHFVSFVTNLSFRSEGLKLRVYRADPNPLVSCDPDVSAIPSEAYLQPPISNKNFLISPPGSPPVGWECSHEEPPNATPLADDLMEALRKVHLQQRSSERRKSLEVLIEPDESGVGVYVEDCDVVVDQDGYVIGVQEEREEDWIYGVTAPARTRWTPAPTAMPPVQPISV